MMYINLSYNNYIGMYQIYQINHTNFIQYDGFNSFHWTVAFRGKIVWKMPTEISHGIIQQELCWKILIYMIIKWKT